MFGGLTTLVNIAVFWLGTNWLHWYYLVANLVAWVLSVWFAFETNHRWVFMGSTAQKESTLIQLCRFFLARGVSLVIDMGCMIGLVQGIRTSELTAKLVTQVVVVILNYLLSVHFVFGTPRKRSSQEERSRSDAQNDRDHHPMSK
ncbi:GtrA family protein [Lacticaseibacillus mingshuiensis]|uniref:GtrA family protein n=1 Tax=Lacticaseibacillus mingshuiensis TaxID=2799574 RepID=UPI00194E48E8|nr:GtrA family protein [Lacticaseibacillus mingshuiensis]